MRDTIFRETVDIDTLIGDRWYNLNLQLKYPNKIIAKPTFNSEKYIIFNSKKETINPPKKFFLLRWFQKKYTVLNITLKENNPYAEVEKQKFVEIIK